VVLYARGMRLARLCTDRLDAAELRVSQIAEGVDGEPVRGPFEPSAFGDQRSGREPRA